MFVNGGYNRRQYCYNYADLKLTVVSGMEKPLPNSPKDVLNRSEAANYIGVSTKKFNELVRQGRMPTPRLIDDQTMWYTSELDKFFDKLSTGWP